MMLMNMLMRRGLLCPQTHIRTRNWAVSQLCSTRRKGTSNNIHVATYSRNIHGRRFYHTSLDLEKEQRVRLATLRLYRILQRTCTEFDTNPGKDSVVLLQPILEAPDWGRHAIFKPSTPTQLEELFRLFYVWNDTTSHRGLGVFSNSSSNDVTDEDTATPRRLTTATTDSTSPYSSDSYTPSSIDDWYYELVSKSSKDYEDVDDDDDDNDDETAQLPPMTSMTCWTSQNQIQDAVRTAFRRLQYDSLVSAADLHKWAIRAIQIIREQQILWKHSSVATTDGVVRVVATSRCIGTSIPTPTSMPPSETTPQILADSAPKYRFAYRIRVENISDDQTVQLMGRYWHISEEPVPRTTGIAGMKANDIEQEAPPPIIVDSPATGAVGQLPVLHPGQVFEYMSGTDLATPKGIMKGHLYMARVPSTTQSAKSGDNVEAFLKQRQKQDEAGDGHHDYSREEYVTEFFEATVAPFQLEAE